MSRSQRPTQLHRGLDTIARRNEIGRWLDSHSLVDAGRQIGITGAARQRKRRRRRLLSRRAQISTKIAHFKRKAGGATRKFGQKAAAGGADVPRYRQWMIRDVAAIPRAMAFPGPRPARGHCYSGLFSENRLPFRDPPSHDRMGRLFRRHAGHGGAPGPPRRRAAPALPPPPRLPAQARRIRPRCAPLPGCPRNPSGCVPAASRA